MNKPAILIVPVFLLFSCTRTGENNSKEKALRKEVMEFATGYVKDILGDVKETVSQNGTITITEIKNQFVSTEDNTLKYIINPAKIYTGLIDDDDREDAIITLNSFKGQYEASPENLILLNTGYNLVLGRVVESNMKILGIKDRLITAEVSSRSRNSPLRDCNECKEVVRYRFKQGNLIEYENDGK